MMEAENRGALFGLLEASMWELPVALQKWMLGMGKGSHEVEQPVLKACQAWTTLANESVERVSQAQGFVGLMPAPVKRFVQCERVARDLMESLAGWVGSLCSEWSDGESAEWRERGQILRR